MKNFLFGRFFGISKGPALAVAALLLAMITAEVFPSLDPVDLLLAGFVVGVALVLAYTLGSLLDENNSEDAFRLLFFGLGNASAWFFFVCLTISGYGHYTGSRLLAGLGILLALVALGACLYYTVHEQSRQKIADEARAAALRQQEHHG